MSELTGRGAPMVGGLDSRLDFGLCRPFYFFINQLRIPPSGYVLLRYNRIIGCMFILGPV